MQFYSLYLWSWERLFHNLFLRGKAWRTVNIQHSTRLVQRGRETFIVDRNSTFLMHKCMLGADTGADTQSVLPVFIRFCHFHFRCYHFCLRWSHYFLPYLQEMFLFSHICSRHAHVAGLPFHAVFACFTFTSANSYPSGRLSKSVFPRLLISLSIVNQNESLGFVGFIKCLHLVDIICSACS